MRQASRFECRPADDDVQQRGGVSLDDEKEKLFDGNAKKGGAENDMRRVRPNIGVDEI